MWTAIKAFFLRLFGRRGPSEAAELPAAERRLANRLLNYWEGKRRGRSFPALADIRESEIAELWPWCFVLDVKESHSFPYFQFLGRELGRYSGVFLSGERDWSLTLLDKATAGFAEVLSRRAPVLIENEIARYDKKKLMFRSVLLPLSDDQANINYVLGAANGKLVDQ
jgi:hypothetical protein